MYLLAISGGPDSMFLLNKYKKKKIIVAHVNYNQRKDSIKDQNIVVVFCQKHNINYQILDVKTQAKGNFQTWARNIRYDFFKNIYTSHNCKKLIIAHHKDDFIETAIMQKESGRNPRFFGIKKNNEIKGMKIWRPYVNKYWKNDLIISNHKKQIDFAIDSSNQKLIYKRNKIRSKLCKKNKKEKNKIFKYFMICNKMLRKKFKKIDYKVQKIIQENHSLKMYQTLKSEKKEVIYEILHKEFNDIKLSSQKINSLIDFINGKENNKKYIINNKSYILKNSKRLIYHHIN